MADFGLLEAETPGYTQGVFPALSEPVILHVKLSDFRVQKPFGIQVAGSVLDI